MSESTPEPATSAAAGLTPLMRQYQAAKQQHPDALLFFRLGDFYELFFEDARTAARELEITLTARDRERQVPMCGVPYHSAELHIARLLRKGYRVAVCEQMEDPRLTRGIVRREITRVWTPGTAVTAGLEGQQNNYLAAIALGTHNAALALLDLSTGEFRATHWAGGAEATAAQCADELQRAGAVEVLVPATLALAPDSPLARALVSVRTRTPVEDWVWTPEYALPLLERQLGARSLDGFGLADHPLAGIAAGALLHYAQATQRGELAHIDTLRFYEQTGSLQLDGVSVRNLELLEPLFSDAGAADATLFAALDCCRTPMGRRMLRATLLRPLVEREGMERRWQATGELKDDLLEREELRRALGGVLDLERLLARTALDSAGPRDLLALAASLAALPAAAAVAGRRSSTLFRELAGRLDPLADVCEAISATLVEEPPATVAEGGFVRAGLHPELDELRAAGQGGRAAIAAIEERERARTGIASLKVRFTSVFGYYIEVTRANLKHVPPDYERKQTLVNAERFTTPELKAHETTILSANERAIEIERALFSRLRAEVLAAGSRLRTTGAAVAELDLLAAFAHLAAERRWCRPELAEGCVLEVAAGRHPVVEHRMERAGTERFVPNDLYMDTSSAALLLLTGPNMGGKSTYLRQAAMLVLMAQMGSWVPATRMRFAPVDRIYTRIGASDNVARGRSTFMVEMTESATILNTATARSLVLIDEMGRGTATYDGLSLAWATLEYLHNHVGARTLFATHYHELTLLGEQLPRLRNLHVAVRESRGQGIVFLHAIEPGPASKSYGIEVARLAGLPRGVIERAREVLRLHERAERVATTAPEPADAPLQLTMFTPLSQRILDRLEEADINTLTPLQALNLLGELKDELRTGRG